MVEIDLTELHGRVLDLAPELHATDAPRVRFAYRGLRLAPVSGVARAELIAVLGVEPAPMDPSPSPASEAAAPQDESGERATEVIRDDDGVEEPVAAPPPSPVAAAFLDALALQMHVIDVFGDQDYRIEHLGAREIEQLGAAGAVLERLESELAGAAAEPEVAQVFAASLRKIGRELSSLATHLELTIANVTLALETDAASDRRRDDRARKDLAEAARVDGERAAERGHKAKSPPAASSGGSDAVKLGRLKIRFSERDLRSLRIIAFGAMPALLLAVVLVSQRCHSAPVQITDSGAALLRSVQGRADGKLYVVTLSSWSDFESERARLVELAKAIASRGYESARFENGGHTVAMWEQGQLRAGP